MLFRHTHTHTHTHTHRASSYRSAPPSTNGSPFLRFPQIPCRHPSFFAGRSCPVCGDVREGTGGARSSLMYVPSKGSQAGFNVIVCRGRKSKCFKAVYSALKPHNHRHDTNSSSPKTPQQTRRRAHGRARLPPFSPFTAGECIAW